MSWLPPANETMPVDSERATLAGRVWEPEVGGPTPVIVFEGIVRALTPRFATISDLMEEDDPAAAARSAAGRSLGALEVVHANSQEDRRDAAAPWFLAPHDLQAVKGAGVTFAVSMIERVIEERVRGDNARAAELRELIAERIGGDLRGIAPGSPDAEDLKQTLIAEGVWSQYLEVGIGPDAEIFTKAAPLSAVGTGAAIGVLSSSAWNNPEPEIAIVISSTGRVVGATLANDVNLRDIEGRSALLLGKAKDNNASASTGPLIRLFDDTYDLDDVRGARVSVAVDGPDGFRMRAVSDMSLISRDPLELVDQLMGRLHQYPDDVVLMMGTMFAPIDDRGAPGKGFTHEIGDIVAIRSDHLGSLVNIVRHSEDCEPWSFGVRALMRNLRDRDVP